MELIDCGDGGGGADGSVRLENCSGEDLTVVETLWPLPMLLSVLVVADGQKLTDGGDGGGADRRADGDGGWRHSGHCQCSCLCR